MDAMRLDAIEIGDRVRKDMGDLNALAASMKRHGLLHPVVVKKDGTLIAGHRRMEAAKLLGWDNIPVTVIEIEDLLSAERDENTERKDFTPTEAVAIGRLIEDQERPKAEERKRQAQERGRATRYGRHLDDGDSPTPKIRVRESTAKAVGMGCRKYVEAKEVVAAAEEDPKVFGDLPSMMDETGNVHGMHREMERRRGKLNGKKVPLNKAGKNPDRIQEQQMRASIWQQVKDSLINLTSLPDAGEVVAIVRAHARDKNLIDKKLAPALNWLREFSDGWCKGNGTEG